jgi:tetratricopeptide (TPR) repeat protein
MRSGGRVVLFYSFAHRLLLTFGLFVFVVLAILAVKVGLLGDQAKSVLMAVWEPARDRYLHNRTTIDTAIAVIGTIGSGVLAALSVHKWWHYAEMNLPARIAEFNERAEREVEDHRRRGIPALAHAISISSPTEAGPSFFKRLLIWLHDRNDWKLADSQLHAANCAGTFEVLTASRKHYESVLVSAHLEYGARLSRAGRREEALVEFKKALRIKRDDLDALELVARELAALNRPDRAGKFLQDMAKAATRAGDALRAMRAVRFQAEVLKGGMEPDRRQARNALQGAITILTRSDGLDKDDKTIELCLAYGQLADVQRVRSVLSAGRTAMNRARARFGQLDPAKHETIRYWLDEIDVRLRQAEADRDKDHDDDDPRADDRLPSDSPEPGDGAADGKGDG